MKRVFAVTAVVALLGFGIAASAAITIDTVTVGDAGNAADSTGFGSVGYNYNIGKYEVTAEQYCEFLNNKAQSDPYGLYNSWMWDAPHGYRIERTGSSGSYSYSANSPNMPIYYVSFWDACRFTNWLNNGQEDGDTETGAYTIPDGYNGDSGNTIQRNTGAKWFIPSEDEWYKAAYYKGGGIDAGYWRYPTQSNSINIEMANYSWSSTTNVGSYGFSSAYGTFDQGGNVREWTETIVASHPRVIRGGCFQDEESVLRADYWPGMFDVPNLEQYHTGFRVASVPEPSSIIALAGGLISLLRIRRRRA